MKRLYVVLAAAALGLGATARAGFVNGGFEDGNFTGWTLEYGRNYGSAITWTNLGSTPNGHQYIISKLAPQPGDPSYVLTSYTDYYNPAFSTPFGGNYMARLNEPSGNYDASRISQTGTMASGENQVFIQWGAVMQDPGHPYNEQPYFDIEVFKNGTSVGHEYHNASDPGWTYNNGAYYSSGVYNLTGLAEGDNVQVVMTAADCGQGGHFGYAYLDGIGTVNPVSAPDGAVTGLLVLPALLGLLALRRRR